MIRMRTRIYQFACKKNRHGVFHHLKLSKILLRLFGLWPYDKTITKRCCYLVFVMYTLVISTILIEGLTEMPVWDTVVVAGTVVGIVWLLGSLMLVTTLHMGEHTLKKLYDQMEANWRAINVSEEVAIMETFTRRATSVFLIYAGWAIVLAPLWICLTFGTWTYENPEEYEKMFSMYSRRWIVCEDLRKLQITFHIALSLGYASMLYIAILYVYLYSVNHACGVFAIVGYRLRKLGKPNDVILADNVKVPDKIIPQLLHIIDKHRVAIRTTKIVGKTFSASFHTLQIMGLICVAVLIFRLQLSFNLKSIQLTLRVVPMLAVILQYGFYLNYGGEQIIEFSNQVFIATCSTSWDSMSMKAKKIVSMLILRSSNSCVLKVGLMTLSLQNFKTLINIAWSSATVLFTTQKQA